MSLTRSEIKVTVAKLLELAYSEEQGGAVKILRSKGLFKLSIDQTGNAQLSGKLGVVNFSGTPVLEKIGLNIRSVSINFSHANNDLIHYHATFDLKVAKMAVSGSFDVEALITSCSGALCRAAKLMRGRNQAYEMELQKIMGY